MLAVIRRCLAASVQGRAQPYRNALATPAASPVTSIPAPHLAARFWPHKGTGTYRYASAWTSSLEPDTRARQAQPDSDNLTVPFKYSALPCTRIHNDHHTRATTMPTHCYPQLSVSHSAHSFILLAHRRGLSYTFTPSFVSPHPSPGSIPPLPPAPRRLRCPLSHADSAAPAPPLPRTVQGRSQHLPACASRYRTVHGHEA